ncbi:MAG: hypothetical protein JSW29_03990 [Candidatus Bathyarchaeota archaeon]|nr:MAG: hypothetical protein JSW29_03990 [Candidatus Bathyarchaeota archaeon]
MSFEVLVQLSAFFNAEMTFAAINTDSQGLKGTMKIQLRKNPRKADRWALLDESSVTFPVAGTFF